MEKDAVFQDLLRPAGFLKALGGVLRLKELGLLFGGVPCNSFCYLSSNTHGRTYSNPWGNEQYGFVHSGNILGSRFLILCCIAAVRMCRWVIENPQATIIFCLPPLKFVLWNRSLGGRVARWWMPQHVLECAVDA